MNLRIAVATETQVNSSAQGDRGANAPSFYLPTLDGLRFLAFLLVLIHHLPRSPVPVLGYLHDQGWVGVHIFFALSAYLLARILVLEWKTRGDLSIWRFYARRCLRLWPLYYIFCTAILLYVIVSDSLLPGHTGRYLGLMSFVDNIVSGLTWYNPIPWTAHLWTISLEEQFYLIFPLLLLVSLRYPRLRAPLLIGTWVVFIAVRTVCVIFSVAHPFIWTSLFSADALLFGTAIGVSGWKPAGTASVRALTCAGAIGGLLCGGVFPGPDVTGAHQVFIYALIAGGAVLLLIMSIHDPLMRFLAVRPLPYLGKISYGLYVFHFLGIALGNALLGYFGVGNWWLRSAAGFLFTLALAGASYRLIERPFLTLKLKHEAVHTRPV